MSIKRTRSARPKVPNSRSLATQRCNAMAVAWQPMAQVAEGLLTQEPVELCPQPDNCIHSIMGQLLECLVPRHLRRCTLCGIRALGDERHFVFDCPHFAHIRRQFRSLYQDADGTMQCFVWHKDQKAVCHCLAAILNVADDSNKDASS